MRQLNGRAQPPRVILIAAIATSTVLVAGRIAGGRALLHALSRLSTDVIDFTTSEFGFLKIGDAIAAGSSMMPQKQKKNPDIFELVRAKTAHGVGHVMSMLTLVKGLPSGYNRDFQDDRAAVLDTGPLVRGAVRAVHLAIPNLTFDRARCLAAVSDGSTQATDVAEALVRKGVPFREAYKATGQLVHIAHTENFPLSKMTVERAKTVHEKFDADVLAVPEARDRIVDDLIAQNAMRAILPVVVPLPLHA